MPFITILLLLISDELTIFTASLLCDDGCFRGLDVLEVALINDVLHGAKQYKQASAIRRIAKLTLMHQPIELCRMPEAELKISPYPA